MNTSYSVFLIIDSTRQSCFGITLFVSTSLMKCPVIAATCECSFGFLSPIIGSNLMSVGGDLSIFIFPVIDASFATHNRKASFYTSWLHRSICHCLLLSSAAWDSIMIFLARSFLITPQFCPFIAPTHWVFVHIRQLYFLQHSDHFLTFDC